MPRSMPRRKPVAPPAARSTTSAAPLFTAPKLPACCSSARLPLRPSAPKGIEDDDKTACFHHHQRRARGVSMRARCHHARRATRAARPDRLQGRLRVRRLRRLQHHAGRSPGLFLPDACRRSRRPRYPHHRGHGERREAARAAAKISGNGGAAVWHLHLGHAGRFRSPAAQESAAERGTGSLLSGRQSLPVHRLRQDRARGSGNRRGDAGGGAMNVITNNKWIGQRTIRPDGADKVTGRAAFAADTTMPGMIWGKVKRSPHPHARIKSIDTSKAEALPGVKAVVTARDIVDFPVDKSVMLGIQDMRWMCRNVMAREKALFPGHPVAAVAATSEAIAAKACELIDVDYEVLPWTIEIDDALKADAPILHEFNTFEGKPSNIAGKLEVKKGDIEQGFKEAEIVIERTFTTRPVHQGYIEPHPCLISVGADNKTTIWSSSQGQFMVRAMTAYLTGIPQSDIRAIPAEIGGGFGGKTIVYLEPLATILARKSGRPVKMVMTREEVMRATGPTSGSKCTVKIGATKDGKIVAGHGIFYLQAGALPGSPIRGAVGCSFSPYDIPHVLSEGFDVCSNRSKVAAYRAPGAPIGAFAVECVLDEVASALKMDPLDFRLKNAAKEGTKAAHGPVYPRIGFVETPGVAKN